MCQIINSADYIEVKAKHTLNNILNTHTHTHMYLVHMSNYMPERESATPCILPEQKWRGGGKNQVYHACKHYRIKLDKLIKLKKGNNGLISIFYKKNISLKKFNN